MRWTLRLAALLAFTLGGVCLLPQPARAEQDNWEDDDFSIEAMTPMEMLAFSEETKSEIDGSLRKVLKMVQEAQKEKDLILLNCLDEKLAALKPLAKVATDVDIALQEAMTKENNDQMVHEMQRLVLARQQARLILAEAEACVPGTGADYTGTGRWQSTGPEDGDSDDVYEYEPEGFVQPADASAYN